MRSCYEKYNENLLDGLTDMGVKCGRGLDNSSSAVLMMLAVAQYSSSFGTACLYSPQPVASTARQSNLSEFSSLNWNANAELSSLSKTRANKSLHGLFQIHTLTYAIKGTQTLHIQ